MKNILLTKLIFLISLGSFAASADITQRKTERPHQCSQIAKQSLQSKLNDIS